MFKYDRYFLDQKNTKHAKSGFAYNAWSTVMT